MRIVYLAAGAAGMYCGSCLHDNTLATGLRALGADVLLVPTYTPLRTDEIDVSQRRVFFGGINVYLQQKSSLFRHTPWCMDRWLDSPELIRWLAARGASTDPADLGDLTVSMLQGEHGNQSKELTKLVRWLKTEVRPDVVHLSNSMLLGMARQIRDELGIPVLCTLSGEDIFLEQLAEPHYSTARQLLRERAADVHGFVALNHYFADFMAEYLSAPRERIQVIPHGLLLDGHGTRSRAADETHTTIGFFARICPEKGLHLLAEAFHLLTQDATLPPLRLRAAGYLGSRERPYLEAITRRMDDLGLADRFEYAGELDRAQKIAFLQSLDMMSVPTVYHESKGISVLEALANAVPVVLPAHGTFPEMIADTQGGLLCEPEDPASLADALRQLIVDPARAAALGSAGQQRIREHYTQELMSRRTLDWYTEVCGAQPSPSSALADR